MTDYVLTVETESRSGLIRLRLRDRDGVHQGAHQVSLSELDRTLWGGLLDARVFIRTHEGRLRFEGTDEPASAARLLERLGLFLADSILGPEIAGALAQGRSRRTLQIRLPETASEPLAAALARVPWELARRAQDEDDFLDRNLVITVTTAGMPDRDAQVAAVARQVSEGDTPLRVLLVYADATEASSLAWRRERDYLMRRFETDIMPHRNVEVDVLSHGVTRALLEERIRASGGYHVIHWTGHGLRDRLELLGEDGRPEPITGSGVVELIDRAGGFVPQLVFLSACLSGTLFDTRDPRIARLISAQGESEDRDADGDGDGDASEADPAGPADFRAAVETGAGYSGTALALLQAGVPQAVAMRYRVSDGFACELAGAFYHRLLADREPRAVEDALHFARRDVADRGSVMARRAPADRANPLALGHPGRTLVPNARRSDQLRRLRPRPQPLLVGDDRLERPEQFVGRTHPLTRLHRDWLTRDAGRGVALIRGQPDIGKTALAAEALHLWHRRFDYVLAFCTSDQRLAVDSFYRRCDERLALASKTYREKYEDDPYQRVYLEPGKPLKGDARHARMRTNLLEALRDEAVLLVLDGFETNLESIATNDTHAAADPEWDRLLAELVRDLPATRSRLLMTTSVAPAALARNPGVLDIELGLLPRDEARLFIASYDDLHRLMLTDREGYDLGARLLRLAAGHPGELSRLASLAADRAKLTQELDRLEA